MPRESNKTKISLRLFDGDLERLRRFYPANGYNEVIRALVHAHLNRLETRANSLLSSALPEADADVFEKGNSENAQGN